MSHDTFDSKESIEHKSGGDMRIFIFKSEAKPDLRAFGGDLAGIKLPASSSRGVQWAPSRQIRIRRTKSHETTSKRRLRNAAFSFFASKKKTKAVL